MAALESDSADAVRADSDEEVEDDSRWAVVGAEMILVE